MLADDMQRPVPADAEASGRQDWMPPTFPLGRPGSTPAVPLHLCTERANYVMFVTLLLKRRCKQSMTRGFGRPT